MASTAWLILAVTLFVLSIAGFLAVLLYLRRTHAPEPLAGIPTAPPAPPAEGGEGGKEA